MRCDCSPNIEDLANNEELLPGGKPVARGDGVVTTRLRGHVLRTMPLVSSVSAVSHVQVRGWRRA